MLDFALLPLMRRYPVLSQSLRRALHAAHALTTLRWTATHDQVRCVSNNLMRVWPQSIDFFAPFLSLLRRHFWPLFGRPLRFVIVEAGPVPTLGKCFDRQCLRLPTAAGRDSARSAQSFVKLPQ